MYRARASLSWLALLVLASGCKHQQSAPPEGAWRDQYIFVGDDASVLVLGVHRQDSGTAEAKIWQGAGGTWQAVLYRRFDIARRDAPDLAATLKRLGRGGVRASVAQTGAELTIDLRTPDRAVSLSAAAMRVLAETRDPEGTTRYRAGRVWVRDGNKQLDGWLIAEQTPPATPRAPFVDYGDFVFVVTASAAHGVLVAKRSRRRPQFDHAVTLTQDRVTHTQAVDITVAPAHVDVTLESSAVHHRYPIADRKTSTGTSPGGRPLVYETLLLAGPEPGVAFVIRPAKEGAQ